MKFCTKSLLGLASLLLLATSLHAQDIAAGNQYGHIQAGAGYMHLDNDYSGRASGGLTVWGDYDFFRAYHVEVGAEAELHFGGIISPDDIGENTYLIGPRFGIYKRRRVSVSAKVVFGRGTISNQLYHTSSSFNVYAFGGGVDYRIARKFNLRVDAEEQKWPNFEPHTLSPIPVSIGLMYLIR